MVFVMYFFFQAEVGIRGGIGSGGRGGGYEGQSLDKPPFHGSVEGWKWESGVPGKFPGHDVIQPGQTSVPWVRRWVEMGIRDSWEIPRA